MKKKVLLILSMVFIFALVLAFSVSAELYGESDIYYFDATVEELSSKTTEDALFYAHRDSADIITEYEGAFPKTNASGEAISWYKLGQATVGSDIFVAVKSFVANDPAYSTINTGNGMYKFITSAGPTKQNIVSINFPNDSGIKSFSDGSSYGLNARSGDYYPAGSELLFAYFPNTWCDSNRIVQATPVLEVCIHPDAPFNTINGKVYEEPTLNNTAFHGCKSVRKIVFPKALKVIADGATSGTAYGAMYYCSSLIEVVFPEGSALTTIGARAFSYCTSLTKLSLPNTVTTIGLRAFEQCHSIQELRLSDNLTTITDGQSFLWESRSLTKLYLPASIVESMTSITGSHVFHGTGTKGVIFFTGSLEELNKLKSILASPNDNQQRINHENVLAWDSSISDDEYVQKAIDENKYYVVYNYSKCNAFYDNNHVGETQMVYGDNMYFENANICTVCTRCNDTAVEKTLSPLFKSLGYSYSSSAIMQGFGVNYTVLAEYKAFYEGNEISFGLIATTFANAKDGMLINAEKKAQVDLTTKGYDIFEMKITGIDAENQATSLFLCGYITVGDKTYYLSVGKCNESALDFATSYESVSASGATKIE